MGSVYLIGDKERYGYYKIGVTRGNVNKRLKALQTGNGGELYIEKIHTSNYPFIVENILHNRLSHKNRINEWFELDLEDIVNFNDNCESIEKLIISMKDNPFFKKKYLKE